jgi:hypothetical protein
VTDVVVSGGGKSFSSAPLSLRRQFLRQSIALSRDRPRDNRAPTNAHDS